MNHVVLGSYCVFARLDLRSMFLRLHTRTVYTVISLLELFRMNVLRASGVFISRTFTRKRRIETHDDDTVPSCGRSSCEQHHPENDAAVSLLRCFVTPMLSSAYPSLRPDLATSGVTSSICMLYCMQYHIYIYIWYEYSLHNFENIDHDTTTTASSAVT